MTTLRINFADFWKNFPPDNNYIINALRCWYDVQIVEKPDFLFYADGGERKHLGYDCVKIYFSFENKVPNLRQCDYAFTYRYLDDPRHLRLPFYVICGSPELLMKHEGEAERILSERKKFCCMVVSYANPRRTRRRIEFFQKLSKYKQVDSGGRFMNNIGAPVTNKAAFLRDYKFHLCFENSSSPGYVTEKLVQAMQARCLPIYWGNPRIGEEFNTRSFINIDDNTSDEEAIERIMELDKDDAKYLAMAREPYFNNNIPNKFYDIERLRPQFEKIFASTRHTRSTFYFKDIIFDIRVKWHVGRP